MNKIERRYTSQPVLVDGDSPKITGYAAVFNSPSEDMGFIEQVDPHAFDNTLNDDVRALWNHDSSHVLGRTKSGTLRLSVDAKGLKYEIDPPDTQAARDLMTSMKRGDVDSSSFGFITNEDKWDYSTTPATRTLLSVSLFDVSPVTYPAYQSATSEARNFPDGMPDSVVSALSAKAEVRDDADSDAADVLPIDCQCGCGQCEADSCELCSNEDCDDPNCDCSQIRSIKLALDVAKEF
jgi:HK97 family phage prohead protease